MTASGKDGRQSRTWQKNAALWSLLTREVIGRQTPVGPARGLRRRRGRDVGWGGGVGVGRLHHFLYAPDGRTSKRPPSTLIPNILFVYVCHTFLNQLSADTACENGYANNRHLCCNQRGAIRGRCRTPCFATSSVPCSRAALSLLGFCYYHQQDFRSAAQTYEELVMICPNIEEYVHSQSTKRKQILGTSSIMHKHCTRRDYMLMQFEQLFELMVLNSHSR